MNKMRKFITLFIVVLFTSMFNPITIHAQGGPGDPGCDPLDPACPIDGGLSLLIAAGIGIAAKKTYNIKKQSDKIM